MNGEPMQVCRGRKIPIAAAMPGSSSCWMARPLVISGEIPRAEIEYPMALVILGGRKLRR